MGREATRRAMNPREVGLEAYELALAVAMTPEQALHTGIDAAVRSAVFSTMTEIRDNLLITAEEIDANEDNDLNDDGPASLIWFAMTVDDVLPPEKQKGN